MSYVVVETVDVDYHISLRLIVIDLRHICLLGEIVFVIGGLIVFRLLILGEQAPQVETHALLNDPVLLFELDNFFNFSLVLVIFDRSVSTGRHHFIALLPQEEH